jgi:hypothetical protein
MICSAPSTLRAESAKLRAEAKIGRLAVEFCQYFGRHGGNIYIPQHHCGDMADTRFLAREKWRTLSAAVDAHLAEGDKT